MTPEEEISRAERARQVIEDPLVKAALADIEAGLIAQWRASPVKEKDLREHIWALYCAATKFREVFESVMQTGKLARIQLQQPKSR